MIQRTEQNLALVSMMYEGSCLLLVGGTYVSMNLEMFSVAKLQLLTSGLGFLCVFFRKYNISSVLVLCGSIKKLYCLLVICFVSIHFLQYFVNVLDMGCGVINVSFM